jgi:hypothetical protein
MEINGTRCRPERGEALVHNRFERTHETVIVSGAKFLRLRTISEQMAANEV